ncbi:unnamed protein product [Kluyveromyces dobzhanskii CBS 2104]|uniref:WGS project CCBQ000000000 data, contig 00015 n=1 Tax=Kluyveromyces dobzhanskii CBS 2104 TaxID=1427455 RepID=A0A0A8LB76_9SACH|nr:unnamed protein product [Kluyveromyces dobzhanskii CBS 2104]
MPVGQGSEDDNNKMIVETELVQTDKHNILPVSQQPVQQFDGSGVDTDVEISTLAQKKPFNNAKRDTPGSPTRKDGIDKMDAVEFHEDPAATLKAMQNQNRVSSLQTQDLLLQEINSHGEKEGTPLSHQHTNPLSTHASYSTGLRNKKSSLLIDCTADGARDFSLPPLNGSDQMLDLSLASKNSPHELHSFTPSMTKQKPKPQLSKLSSYQEEPSDSRVNSDVPLNASQDTKGSEWEQRQGIRTPSSPPPQQLVSQISLGGSDLNVSKNGALSASGLPHQPLQQKLLHSQTQVSNNAAAQMKTTPNNMTSNAQIPPSLNADSESVRKLNKESSSKADFFAARLATAVGENEISDSEETFVYQSTANSVKNAALNDASATPNNTINSLQNNNNTKSYGIPAKLSAPQLKQNDKLLNRLKNTRHTSISAIPSSQGAPSSNSEQDDVASLRSINRNTIQEIQSVKSHRTQMSASPRKRLSITSLQKPQNRQPQSATINAVNKPSASTTPTRSTFASGQQKPNKAISNLPKNSKQSSSQQMPPLGQNNPKHQSHRRNLSKTGDSKKTALRTRSSKIFDPNGSSLRRYSGVPDDVNLEDFVDRYDGEFDMSMSRSSKKVGKSSNPQYQPNAASRRAMYPASKHTQYDQNDNVSGYREGDMDVDGNDVDSHSDISGIQELNFHDQTNYDELSYADEDHDDIESMFYYNGDGIVPNNAKVGRRFSELDDAAEDVESQGLFYNDGDDVDRVNELQGHGSSQFPYFNQAGEYTPLKSKKLNRKISDFYGDYSPHNFYTKKSSWSKFKNFVYFSFIVASLLTFGFISGFLLATNKELHDFQLVAMDNVLVSLDELVFDITASAFNPSLFTIGIKHVELDLFAKTNHLDTDSNNDELYSAPYQTILLGTVHNLESELQFRGRLLNRNYDVSVASVKLFNPGAPKNNGDNDDGDDNDDDEDNNKKNSGDNSPSEITPYDKDGNHKLENDIDRWKELIKYDFELIIRGNMYYTIPFFNNKRIIPVQQQISVDPDNSPFKKKHQNHNRA